MISIVYAEKRKRTSMSEVCASIVMNALFFYSVLTAVSKSDFLKARCRIAMSYVVHMFTFRQSCPQSPVQLCAAGATASVDSAGFYTPVSVWYHYFFSPLNHSVGE